jgi:hypothetical protein
VQDQLVGQAGGQYLLGDAGPTGDEDVAVPGDRPGGLDRLLDVRAERVAGTALLLHALAGPVRHHEDGRVERRVLAPVRVPDVEHAAPDDLRPHPGEPLGPDP